MSEFLDEFGDIDDQLGSLGSDSPSDGELKDSLSGDPLGGGSPGGGVEDVILGDVDEDEPFIDLSLEALGQEHYDMMCEYLNLKMMTVEELDYSGRQTMASRPELEYCFAISRGSCAQMGEFVGAQNDHVDVAGDELPDEVDDLQVDELRCPVEGDDDVAGPVDDDCIVIDESVADKDAKSVDDEARIYDHARNRCDAPVDSDPSMYDDPAIVDSEKIDGETLFEDEEDVREGTISSPQRSPAKNRKGEDDQECTERDGESLNADDIPPTPPEQRWHNFQDLKRENQAQLAHEIAEQEIFGGIPKSSNISSKWDEPGTSSNISDTVLNISGKIRNAGTPALVEHATNCLPGRGNEVLNGNELLEYVPAADATAAKNAIDVDGDYQEEIDGGIVSQEEMNEENEAGHKPSKHEPLESFGRHPASSGGIASSRASATTGQPTSASSGASESQQIPSTSTSKTNLKQQKPTVSQSQRTSFFGSIFQTIANAASAASSVLSFKRRKGDSIEEEFDDIEFELEAERAEKRRKKENEASGAPSSEPNLPANGAASSGSSLTRSRTDSKTGSSDGTSCARDENRDENMEDGDEDNNEGDFSIMLRNSTKKANGVSPCRKFKGDDVIGDVISWASRYGPSEDFDLVAFPNTKINSKNFDLEGTTLFDIGISDNTVLNFKSRRSSTSRQ